MRLFASVHTTPRCLRLQAVKAEQLLSPFTMFSCPTRSAERQRWHRYQLSQLEFAVFFQPEPSVVVRQWGGRGGNMERGYLFKIKP